MPIDVAVLKLDSFWITLARFFLTSTNKVSNLNTNFIRRAVVWFSNKVTGCTACDADYNIIWMYGLQIYIESAFRRSYYNVI